MSNNLLRNSYTEGYTTTTYIMVVCIIPQTFVRRNTFTAHKRALKKVFMGSFVKISIYGYKISLFFPKNPFNFPFNSFSS